MKMNASRIKQIIALLLCAAALAAVSSGAWADENDGTGAAMDLNGNLVSGALAEYAPGSLGVIDGNALQKMIEDYVKENSLNTTGRDISVGFCYLATGDTWYYNENVWYYSASLYKVPVAMLLAEREAAGEITRDTFFENQYYSGTLEKLQYQSIVNSNNDTGHAMVEWMGGTYSGKCADQIKKYASLADAEYPSSFTEYSYYSAKFYTQVLKTLYNNSEAYPKVIEYMKQAVPNHYLRLNLEGKYEIAQKYGAFEETKASRNNNHAGGIIYTPNPIVVTVMSANIPSYEKHIGNIAQMLADYALTLDEALGQQQAAAALEAQQQAEQYAAQQAAAQQAAATPAPVPETPAPSENSNPSVFVAPETPYTTPAAAAQASSGGGIRSGILGPLAVAIVTLLAVIFIAVVIVKTKKSLAEDEEDDEPEEYEPHRKAEKKAKKQKPQKKAVERVTKEAKPEKRKPADNPEPIKRKSATPPELEYDEYPDTDEYEDGYQDYQETPAEEAETQDDYYEDYQDVYPGRAEADEAYSYAFADDFVTEYTAEPTESFAEEYPEEFTGEYDTQYPEDYSSYYPEGTPDTDTEDSEERGFRTSSGDRYVPRH